MVNSLTPPRKMAQETGGILQTIGVNDVYEPFRIHLNTRARDGGTLDDAVFYIDQCTDILGFKLVEASVPFSFYVIHAQNNTFTLTSASGGPYTVTIPIGNYTATTLLPALNTTLSATASTAGPFTSTYSSLTGKIGIQSTLAEAWTLTFVADGGISPAIWFGFNPGTTIAASGTGLLTAPNVLQITGPNFLHICSSLGTKVAANTRVNGSSTVSAASIGKVFVNQNPGSSLQMTEPAPQYFFDMGGGYLQQIELWLEMEDFSTPFVLGLNGAAFAVTIDLLVKRKTTLASIGGSQGGGKRLRQF